MLQTPFLLVHSQPSHEIPWNGIPALMSSHIDLDIDIYRYEAEDHPLGRTGLPDCTSLKGRYSHCGDVASVFNICNSRYLNITL